MNSIRKRLVGNFMLVIMITVIILEIFWINEIRIYYYNNVEEILTNQIRISSNYYTRYFSNATLKDNVLDNVDAFWTQSNAEVQIIDKNKKILMDSIGAMNGSIVKTEDVEAALKGEKGKWIGDVKYDDSSVMAISYPLRNDSGDITGVIRFVSSLKEVNKTVAKISMLLIGIGGLVILISGFVSIFLANSIVEPLKNVTLVAEKMAKGDFKVRSIKKYNDEIGRLSDTLNFMAEEILKNDRLKNEFISSVSHELRTPLTSIKGWAITLNSDIEDKELIKDGLEIIENESDRLSSMVEELLDFSKFVSGRVTLNKKAIDIKNVVELVKRQLTPRAQREKIDFIVNFHDNIPGITADENRIKQVLINVIDNAFNFTTEGGKVEINVESDDKKIYMSIKDTGCGIPKEDLPRIKEKFYKGKTSKSKNGIGLSICDEIITMHNGNLDIKSQYGKGTEVLITLPIN